MLRKHLFSDRVDLEYFVDQLTLPCLVIDPTTKKILFSNQQISDVLNIPREELTEYDLTGLFDLTSILPIKSDPLKPGSYQVQIKIKLRNPLPVHMSVIGVTPENKSLLCLIQRVSISQNSFIATDIQPGLVQRLVDILVNNTEQPVEDLLNEATIVTGLKNVGLYLAEEETPVFQLVNMIGDNSILPSQIPSRDVPMLKNVVLWSPGNRTIPLSTLVIAARSKKISFLASFPIGTPDAIIGFLVFADNTTKTPDDFSALGAMLTSILNLAIAHTSLTQELRGKLTVSQGKLNSLAITTEHIKEGLMTISPDLLIKGMNPAAEAIFGYSTQEALDQPVEHILIGSESLTIYLDEAQKGHSSQHKDHLRLYRRNGDDFLAHLQFIPVLKEGLLNAIVILIDDLSEKEKNRIQTEQLEQRAFLGEVTAIFAHEVRNPINNISTGLQLMSRNLPVDDPNQEEITRLEQDCDRLVELMKSVLSLSKPTDYFMASLDIGQLLRRLLDRRLNRLQNSRVFLDLQVKS